MDKLLYESLLFDYYNPLLTNKQRDAYEMYYLNDMSLGEISEITGVTPQGVSDMLKRTYGLLEKYEAKLKLVENQKNVKLKIDTAMSMVDHWVAHKNISDIKAILLEILEYI